MKRYQRVVGGCLLCPALFRHFPFHLSIPDDTSVLRSAVTHFSTAPTLGPHKCQLVRGRQSHLVINFYPQAEVTCTLAEHTCQHLPMLCYITASAPLGQVSAIWRRGLVKRSWLLWTSVKKSTELATLPFLAGWSTAACGSCVTIIYQHINGGKASQASL